MGLAHDIVESWTPPTVFHVSEVKNGWIITTDGSSYVAASRDEMLELLATLTMPKQDDDS